MDQRGAEHDFMLRERWNGTPFTPCPRPYFNSVSESVPDKLHGRRLVMTVSNLCLHGWNIDHDNLIPQWITIPDVAAVCK